MTAAEAKVDETSSGESVESKSSFYGRDCYRVGSMTFNVIWSTRTGEMLAKGRGRDNATVAVTTLKTHPGHLTKSSASTGRVGRPLQIRSRRDLHLDFGKPRLAFIATQRCPIEWNVSAAIPPHEVILPGWKRITVGFVRVEADGFLRWRADPRKFTWFACTSSALGSCTLPASTNPAGLDVHMLLETIDSP